VVRWLAAVSLLFSTAASGPAPVVKRIAAEEARQGVASDGVYVYAIDNNRIGKYRIADGRRVASWEGPRSLFPHMNSCAVVKRELVCAASNHSAVPQTSSVEFFDKRSLRHVRSHSFGITEGSLTVLDWHNGAWWGVFAHYNARGGEPGKDNRYSQLVKLDPTFRPMQRWVFPPDVLALMKPHSASGASWSADGRLAVSGHDRPEIYLMRLPGAGSVLELDKTIPVSTEGQAIDWDPVVRGRMWSISRVGREMVASDLSAALQSD
jgi:hypothetical protein